MNDAVFHDPCVLGSSLFGVCLARRIQAILVALGDHFKKMLASLDQQCVRGNTEDRLCSLRGLDVVVSMLPAADILES